MGDLTHLLEKIVRLRVRESAYWKVHCFGLTLERLVDKAAELRCVGGAATETTRPTPFLCLLLRLLQLAPSLDAAEELVAQPDFKYLRALACVYVRLTAPHEGVYRALEPVLADYRRLRKLDRGATWTVVCMDEFADELLTKPTCLGIALPRLMRRRDLVKSGRLASRGRESSVRAEFDAIWADEEEGEGSGEEDSEGSGEEEEEPDEGPQGPEPRDDDPRAAAGPAAPRDAQAGAEGGERGA